MTRLEIFRNEKFIGKKIILQHLQKSDLKLCLYWLKDPKVNKFLGQNFNDLDEDQENQWFEAIRKSGTDIIFSILTKRGKIYIGNCGLHKINWEDKTCEFGIVIGDKLYWNKGFGTDATRTVIAFGFKKLKMLKILLTVYEYNYRAIRVYQNCGFKLIKILEKDHIYNNKHWDTYTMELSGQQ